MQIKFSCQCGCRITTDETAAGRTVKCQKCGRDVPVPVAMIAANHSISATQSPVVKQPARPAKTILTVDLKKLAIPLLVVSALAILVIAAAIRGNSGTTPKASQVSTPAAANYVAISGVGTPYHKPSCRYGSKIAAYHRVVYPTQAAAEAAGHRPCHVCNP